MSCTSTEEYSPEDSPRVFEGDVAAVKNMSRFLDEEYSPRILLVLEGDIAAGKTTVGKDLAARGEVVFLEETYAKEDLLLNFYNEPDFEKSKYWFFRFQMWVLENFAQRMAQIEFYLHHKGVKCIVMDRSILATIAFLKWYCIIDILPEKKRDCLIELAEIMWEDFLVFIKKNFDRTILVNLTCPPHIGWERYIKRQNGQPTKLTIQSFQFLKKQETFKKSVWHFTRAEEYDTSLIDRETLVAKISALCQ